MVEEETIFHVLIISPTWDSWPSNDKLMRELFPSFIVVKGIDAVSLIGEWKTKAKMAIQNPLDHEVNEAYIIFVDYYLSVSNGLDFLQDIRRNPRLNHVHVIVMSVLKDGWQDDRCLEAGALDCILLPLTPSKMEKVKQHVQEVEAAEGQQQHRRKQDHERKRREEEERDRKENDEITHLVLPYLSFEEEEQSQQQQEPRQQQEQNEQLQQQKQQDKEQEQQQRQWKPRKQEHQKQQEHWRHQQEHQKQKQQQQWGDQKFMWDLNN